MRVTVHPIHDGEEEELKIAISPERFKRLGFGKPLESGEQHPTVTKLLGVLDENKDALPFERSWSQDLPGYQFPGDNGK